MATEVEVPQGSDPSYDDGPIELFPETGEGGQLQAFGVTVGGKRPTSHSLRIVGGRVEIDAEYLKGEVIKVTMLCRVDEVSVKDEKDRETQQVVGCEKRHKASPIEPPTIKRVTD